MRRSATAYAALFLFSSLDGTQDPPPISSAYTPGSLCLDNDWGITFIGEGLYWTSSQHHLTITTANVGLSPTNRIPPALDRWNFRGDMIRFDPPWNYGYRVGGGFTSGCDYWDLFALWTSYENSDSDEVSLVDLPALNIWGYPDTSNAARLFSAKGNWDLSYHILDVAFGRAFWVGQCLNMRPFFGVRSAWIDQSIDLFFDFEPLNAVPFGAQTNARACFSGTGLQAGFDLKFTTGSGFGLFGTIDIALLYGKEKESLTQTETTSLFPPILIAESTSQPIATVAALHSAIGIEYSHCFCSNRFRLGLLAKWEFTNYNGIGKYPHFSTTLSSGIYREEHANLSLMGLSFGGRLDF